VSIYSFGNATFSAKNFNISESNRRFKGIGERTIYVPISKMPEKYNYSQGFKTKVDAPLYNCNASIIKIVKASTPVWFNYPSELTKFSGVRGILSNISLVGSHEKTDGYMHISKILKPSNNFQPRLYYGIQAQDDIMHYIMEYAHNHGFKYSFISSAKIGSTIPDLIISLNGISQQFEIKGTNSISSLITLFDKATRRTKYSPILDDISLIMTSKLFIDNIDSLRRIDKTIGLSGDEGVCKSGRLPVNLTTRDPELLRNTKNIVISHLINNKDNYFTIYDRSNGKPYIYYTGYGKNLLNAPPIPDLEYFSLSTYGGPSNGATRVAIKVKFNVERKITNKSY